MSACKIGSRCGENWVEKKGVLISSNRLYTPPTFENFLVKNHASNIQDFMVYSPLNAMLTPVLCLPGISPQDFDNQTLAVLRGRLVRYLMRSKEVSPLTRIYSVLILIMIISQKNVCVVIVNHPSFSHQM